MLWLSLFLRRAYSYKAKLPNEILITKNKTIMKKLLLTLVLFLSATCSFCQEYVVVNKLRFIISGSEAHLYGVWDIGEEEPLRGEVSIPVSITKGGKTYPVTKILDRAFSVDQSITSVIIPYTVKSIGEQAFSECHKLESVIIGDNVETIGSGAFQETALTSVDLPNSVKTIGSSIFNSCQQLTSVNLGTSVTSIEKLSFQYCTALKSVKIPNTVTSIGQQAFDGCSSLTSADLPDGVKSIGFMAFSGCGFTSVSIPKSVTELGGYCFEDCKELVSAKVYSNAIGSGVLTFNGCTKLKDVYLSPDVTGLGDYTFSDCSSLTTFNNNYVTAIGKYCFKNCSALRTFTATKVTQLGGSCFSGCSSLGCIDLSKCPSSDLKVTSLGNVNVLICLPEGSVSEKIFNIVIGNTCKEYRLEDGKPFYVPNTFDGFTAKSVVYERTFPSNSVSTIFLNYAPPVLEGVKYYKFDNYADGVLTFTEETAPKARTAYIIKTGSEEVRDFFIKTETKISWVNETGAQYYGQGGLLFVGTSQTQDVKALTDVPSYVQVDANTFKKVTSSDTDVEVPPFRAFIRNINFTTVSAPDELSIVLKDAETTGIEAIDNEQFTMDDAAGAWYTIDGVKLSGKPAQKGVYIHNGKKIVVR